jgi:caffeoyl-CoA O-methyltransferase
MEPLVVPAVEEYAARHSWPESEVCRRLREETERTMELPQMLVGPLEGAFLKMMARLTGARRVLEIGTFTGYSALCFAEALPDDGRVTTCEIDANSAAVARRYFAESPHGAKIDLRLAPALDTLAGLTGPFDLVFIDADKVNYSNYYRRSLELLRPGGVVLIDNVLWSGDVVKAPAPDASTAAIQAVNRLVAGDRTVEAVLATVRDGIFVIRKKA